MGSNTELTFAREAAVTSPREARGRDSGLESAEMSDASEVISRYVMSRWYNVSSWCHAATVSRHDVTLVTGAMSRHMM